MTVRASRDTTYAVWTEGDDIFLGVWYTDEFDQNKPTSEQLDKALFIDPISPRSLLNLSLHFLHAGLASMERLFQRLQRPRKPEPEPGDRTSWGQQFKPGEGEDAPSEPEGP